MVRREHALAVLSKARVFVALTDDIEHHAQELNRLGFKPLLPDTSRHVKMDIENREVAETIQSTLALDDGHVVGRLAQDRGLV